MEGSSLAPARSAQQVLIQLDYLETHQSNTQQAGKQATAKELMGNNGNLQNSPLLEDENLTNKEFLAQERKKDILY